MLENKRIFVVEDDWFLAQDLCRELHQAGAVVFGPVPSVAQALTLLAAEPNIDAAVLDVELGEESSFEIAEVLVQRAVPFIFSTGYDADSVSKRYPQVACMEKPVDFHSIAKALATAINA